MATLNEFIKFAENEVGYDRYKDPQKGTKYGRWYAEYTGSSYYGENGVPYCAMFVSYCLNKTGTKCNYFPNAVAFDTRDRPIIGDRWVDKYKLKRGDIIGFDWDIDARGDHVGIILEVHDDYVLTIEGNTDNGKVKRRTRYYANIIGGIRPYFDGDGALAITGIWDRQTTLALQRTFNTPQDGIVSGQSSWTCLNAGIAAGKCFVCESGGSPLIRAIQLWLDPAWKNDKSYGYLDPSTIYALQSKFNTTKDYVISNPSELMCAIQRKLLNNERW